MLSLLVCVTVALRNGSTKLGLDYALIVFEPLRLLKFYSSYVTTPFIGLIPDSFVLPTLNFLTTRQNEMVLVVQGPMPNFLFVILRLILFFILGYNLISLVGCNASLSLHSCTLTSP